MTVFTRPAALSEWLASLSGISVEHVAGLDGELAWSIEMTGQARDPRYVRHPPQRATLRGTGRVAWRVLSETSFSDAIEASDGPDGIRVILRKANAGAVEAEEYVLDARSIDHELAPLSPEDEAEIVRALPPGRHVLADEASLRWFECLDYASLERVDGREVVIECAEREDGAELRVRIRADEVAGEGADDPIDQFEGFVAEDGRLALRIESHAATIELTSRAFEVTVEEA